MHTNIHMHVQIQIHIYIYIYIYMYTLLHADVLIPVFIYGDLR